MSRIGKKPIVIPTGAKVNCDGRSVTVTGPKGVLSRELHPLASIEIKDGHIIVNRKDDSRESRAIHGLTRTLIDNMVVGVTKGFQKRLVVTGVGYKVDEKGNQLVLNLGYSHPIDFTLPKGVDAKVDKQKGITIILESADKELLGLTAAKIRSFRPPEPYKGKGVQYENEVIIRKAGKAATKKK
jgi:large subunit ribosomal protein L6